MHAVSRADAFMAGREKLRVNGNTLRNRWGPEIPLVPGGDGTLFTAGTPVTLTTRTGQYASSPATSPTLPFYPLRIALPCWGQVTWN